MLFKFIESIIFAHYIICELIKKNNSITSYAPLLIINITYMHTSISVHIRYLNNYSFCVGIFPECLRGPAGSKSAKFSKIVFLHKNILYHLTNVVLKTRNRRVTGTPSHYPPKRGRQSDMGSQLGVPHPGDLEGGRKSGGF